MSQTGRMPQDQVIVRDDDPRMAVLQSEGWTITARSWAAQLSSPLLDTRRLRALIARVRGAGELREINNEDIDAVLLLDAATLDDYPGGIATRHQPLTADRARVSRARRAFGFFDQLGQAIAVTYVDIDGNRAETDFTVVDRNHRGRGIGAAVKAASVLALLEDGVEHFRTGGSSENAASLAASVSVGYVVDERWVTLAPTH